MVGKYLTLQGIPTLCIKMCGILKSKEISLQMHRLFQTLILVREVGENLLLLSLKEVSLLHW